MSGPTSDGITLKIRQTDSESDQVRKATKFERNMFDSEKINVIACIVVASWKARRERRKEALKRTE